MDRPLTVGRLVAKLATVIVLFVLVLLVPAGTWRWAAAWGFMALYLAFALPVGLWLYRTNPGLLAERVDWTKRAPKSWDRALLAGLIPAFVATYVLAGLDFRFGWSTVPTRLRAAAFVVVGAFYLLLFLVLRANAFLKRTVAYPPQPEQSYVSGALAHVDLVTF